jgi:hypothetical protein
MARPMIMTSIRVRFMVIVMASVWLYLCRDLGPVLGLGPDQVLGSALLLVLGLGLGLVIVTVVKVKVMVRVRFRCRIWFRSRARLRVYNSVWVQARVVARVRFRVTTSIWVRFRFIVLGFEIGHS